MIKSFDSRRVIVTFVFSNGQQFDLSVQFSGQSLLFIDELMALLQELDRCGNAWLQGRPKLPLEGTNV